MGDRFASRGAPDCERNSGNLRCALRAALRGGGDASAASAREIGLPERLSALVQEWDILNKSIEWNFQIYERQRTILFAFSGVVVGLEALPIAPAVLASDGLPLAAWIATPFIALTLLYRMLSQLHFVNIKNVRLRRIERTIELLTQSQDHFRWLTVQRNDNRRFFSNPYAVTQAMIFMFVMAVITFAQYRGYDGLVADGSSVFGLSYAAIFLGASIALEIVFLVQFVLVSLEVQNPSLEDKLHRS